MKLTSSTVIAAFLSFSTLACANAKSNYFFTDGGPEGGATLPDGGKGDGGVTGSDCPAFCAYAADNGTDCDATKCTTSCKAAKKAATAADCSDQWQALIDCAMGPGTGSKKPVITCTSTGKADITNCTAKKTALSDCLKAATEVDSGPPPGTCTLTQPFDPNNPTCNGCVEQNCCTETNTCMGSTDCVAMVDCLGKCPTTAGTARTNCVNACANSHPTGTPQVQALSTCLNSSCNTACP